MAFLDFTRGCHLSDKLHWAKTPPWEVSTCWILKPFLNLRGFARRQKVLVVGSATTGEEGAAGGALSLPAQMSPRCHLMELTGRCWDRQELCFFAYLSRKASLLSAKVWIISSRGRFLPGECKRSSWSGLWMIPRWFFFCIQSRRDFCLQVTALFSLSLQEGANTRVSELLLCPGWQVSWNNLLPALMLPEHWGCHAQHKNILAFWELSQTLNSFKYKLSPVSIAQRAAECFVCITC